MATPINEACACGAGLSKALELGADADTALRCADQFGEAARRHNATVNLFATLGWDLENNHPLDRFV